MSAFATQLDQMHAEAPDADAQIAQCDWNSPAAVATLARRLWREADDNRRSFKAKVLRNIEFVAGNQWHRWNEQNAVMEPDATRAFWRSDLMFNRILPAIETLISRTVGRDNIWRTPAQTDDLGDRVVARTADAMLKGMWKSTLDMDDKLLQFLGWACTTGEAFFRSRWNPQGGIPIETGIEEFMPPLMGGEPPELVVAAQTEAYDQFKQMFGEEAAAQGVGTQQSGDPEVEVLCPLDVITWPWNIISFDQAQVWMIVRRRTIGEIAAAYGLTPEEVRKIGQPSEDEDWQNTLVERWDQGINGTYRASMDGRETGVVYEFELYVPKGVGGFKNGRAAIVLGFQAEAQFLDDIPGSAHTLPIHWALEKPVPGKLHGTCTVDQMIPGQVELNTAAAQKADYRNKKINPTIVRIQGDLMEGQEFTNDPEKTMTVAGREYMPAVLELPDIGVQHDRDINLAISQLNDLGGASGVDMGSAEEDNVKSGRAILALRQQNDERRRPFGVRLDRCLGKLGSHVLELCQEYAVDERTLHVIGEDNRVELVTFHADLIRPSTYGKSGFNPAMVTCDVFGQMPTTLPEKLAIIQTLMTTNPPVLDPVRDRSAILQALNLRDLSAVFDEERIDQARVAQEHDQWRAGKPVPPPSKADNNSVHLREHRRFAKTDDYREMARSNPMLAMQFEQHLRDHEIAEAREVIRPMYVAKIADFLELAEQRDTLNQKLPGLGDIIFRTPLATAPPDANMNQSSGGSPPPNSSPA